MTSLLKISRLGVERDYMNMDHHMVTRKRICIVYALSVIQLIQVKFVLKKFIKMESND